jgi:hypothetical protein
MPACRALTRGAYKSAYIDLLHGDAYMCTISKASGAPSSDLAFEDYLQNTPNVTGSSGSDVIICDDGVDRITHGSGSGDVLCAWTGVSSQGTFAYTALNESPPSHYDVTEGFKVGIDKLDFTKLDMPISDFLLSYGGNGANTVYVEENPSKGFNSATDMIISVQASSSAALTYKDLIAKGRQSKPALRIEGRARVRSECEMLRPQRKWGGVDAVHSVTALQSVGTKTLG